MTAKKSEEMQALCINWHKKDKASKEAGYVCWETYLSLIADIPAIWLNDANKINRKYLGKLINFFTKYYASQGVPKRQAGIYTVSSVLEIEHLMHHLNFTLDQLLKLYSLETIADCVLLNNETYKKLRWEGDPCKVFKD